ncbi:hypothetical protein OK351_16420 [Glutamicibacter sp. MNS18]|uniref:hypothetical protein n=1 Tax=Glutamicibacter sp. MNS18 TaxID=2989817 RepID=UPI0022364D74|nr:hypothetical protein [Glutamicibacter sp. MNS18]MCW4467070.1 hypothetical protein [Glutamicibacter sp. MNS18]
MSPQPQRLNLSPRAILLWLVLLIGLVANSALGLAHLMLAGGSFLVVTLWAVRVLVLACCWALLPGTGTAKGWGLGLVLAALLLDALLKAPVLGGIEYGDWFLLRSLDLTGAYSGYLTACGFLLPLLMLTGWFILRGRRGPGWIAGLAMGLLMSLATLLASNSAEATTVLFVLLGVGRLVIPAWTAAIADQLASVLARRGNLSTDFPAGR